MTIYLFFYFSFSCETSAWTRRFSASKLESTVKLAVAYSAFASREEATVTCTRAFFVFVSPNDEQKGK